MHAVEYLSDDEIAQAISKFHEDTVIRLYLEPGETPTEGEFIFSGISEDEELLVSFHDMCRLLEIPDVFTPDLQGIQNFSERTQKTIMVTHDGFSGHLTIEPYR